MKQKVLMLAALFVAGAAHGDFAHPIDETHAWCDHLSAHEYLEQTDELEAMTADELEELMAADGVAVDEIADVPVKPFPVDAPEQEVVRDAPEQEKVKDAPEQTIVKDVAKQEVIKDAPEQNAVEDVAKQMAVKDAPEQETVEDVAKQEVIKDAPEQTIVKDVAKQEVIKDAPEQETVRDVAKQEAVTDAPEAELVRDAPEQSGVEDAPVIAAPTEKEMRENVAFLEEAEKYFQDIDNRSWHVNGGHIDAMKDWLAIYKTFEAQSPAEVEHIPLPQGVRMVSCFHLPQDDCKTLRINLRFYRNQGYNAALFIYDDIEHLDEAISLIRSVKNEFGFQVYAAYGPAGEGSSAPPTFLPPERYAKFLRMLAPEIDGFLLGWGRTSVHLFTQDPAYMHFVCSALRDANPRLPILGEMYWGENYKVRKVGAYYFGFNTFKNASADVIQNRGHLAIDKPSVVRKLRTATGHDAVGVVIGPSTEWLAKGARTWKNALAAKQRIEKQFLAAGAAGTITCHADGLPVSKRRCGVPVYEDMSKTLYTEMNAK